MTKDHAEKRIILVRHGNTFDAGDKVVWTGASNDLPLVEKGLQQAEYVAAWLEEQGIKPDKIYCSDLQRTRCFAEKIIQKNQLHKEPIIVSELNEVDYGLWTGKSDAEVITEFGATALENWRNQSQFPPADQWYETEQAVIERVNRFATNYIQNHADKIILLVSSNGVLRYFLKLVTGAFEQAIETKKFAVKTGHICELEYRDNQFTLVRWNENPAE